MRPNDVIKRLDVYVRVSRVGGREGESFISPKEQRERCEAFVRSKGLTVGKVFTDLDESGGKMKRPEFEKALARVRSGESDGIVVARLDRFARNTRGLLEAVEEIEKHGGAFVCVSPTIDTADQTYGRFLLTLFAALAELELGKIRDAWTVAHASMIERGIHAGQPPVGYAKGLDLKRRPLDSEGKGLVLNANADEIREAFRMKAEDGATWGAVARYLTEHNVPTKRGRTTWTAGGARKLLSSRVYLGEARSGSRVKPNAHEALVSEDVFVLANRKAARGKRVERPDGPLLGGGLCRCGTCGSGLLKAATKSNGKRYEFLRCANTACAGGVTISLRVLEPYLVGLAFDLLPETADAVRKMRAEDAVEDADAAFRAAVADVDEIERAHAAGELGAVAYGRALESALKAKEAAEFALVTASGGELGYLTRKAEAVRADLFEEDGTPRDVVRARQFLRDVLGPVTISQGRAPVEERVRLETS